MPVTIADSKLFTVAEVATALQVTPQTLLNYIKKGRIEAQRIGRAFLIPEDSLRTFVGLPAKTPEKRLKNVRETSEKHRRNTVEKTPTKPRETTIKRRKNDRAQKMKND